MSVRRSAPADTSAGPRPPLLALSPEPLSKEAAINIPTSVLWSAGAETSRPIWASDDGGPERRGREELRGITQPNSVDRPSVRFGTTSRLPNPCRWEHARHCSPAHWRAKPTYGATP